MSNKKYGIKLIDDNNKIIYPFDLVNAFNISQSSQVSEFPLVSKKQVSDNKYDLPQKITITNTISDVNYSNAKTYVELDVEKGTFKIKPAVFESYLQKTFKFFEDLKRGNFLFDLHTPSKIIKNCLITDLNWADNVQWGELNLNISEVFTYAIDSSKLEPQIMKGDPNLPDLNDPIPQSFVSDVLLSKGSYEVDMLIKQTLEKEDLLTKRFLEGVANTTKIIGVGVAAGVVALILVKIALMVTNPVGWVVAALVVVGAAIFWIFNSIKAWWKKWQREKTYIKAFEYYKDPSKMESEKKRYEKVVLKIYEGIGKLDNYVKAYTFSSNESQELLITLNNDNYKLVIKKRISGYNRWDVSILDFDGKIIAEKVDLKPVDSFLNLDDTNYIGQVNNEKLYFLYDLEHLKDIYNINGKDVSWKNNANIDLRKVKLITTKLDTEKFREIIKNATLETMKRKVDK